MNPEMVKGLGTTRKRELQSAQKAVEVAKGQLAELQETLAKQKQGQAALAPATLVTGASTVSALAQGLQHSVAANAIVSHLEQVAIPAAQAEVQRTGRLLATQQDNIIRKRAHIVTQQAIITKAQAVVDAAAGWLDT
jgi:glycerol-3-phosphate responsive antiterminator